MKKKSETRKHWSVNHLRVFKAQKMYAGGEVKRRRGPVSGMVTQCLKPGQLDGLGVEHVLIYGGKTLQTHRHHKAEALLIVTKGSGKVILNKKTIRVKSGNVISIPAGTIHGFVTGGHQLEFIAIQRPSVYQPGEKEDLEIVPQ